MTEGRRVSKCYWKRLTPWGLSVLLHVVLASVLAFVVFQPEPGDLDEGALVAYSADSLPRRVAPKPMRTTMVRRESAGEGRSFEELTGIAPQWSDGAESEAQPASMEQDSFWGELERQSTSPAELWADEAAGSESATFFGAESRAKDVVYLIDFSTSLKGSFDAIRREMLRSIGRLGEEQRFHIILFAGGRPLEPRPGRLVPATHAAKSAAAEFLARVQPAGRTEPIAALSRAFAVLGRGGRNSKLICLLTDGAFPDDAAVMRTIKANNAAGHIRINTYLYGGRASSAGTLRRIAEANGGRFVRVSAGGRR